MTNDEAVIIPQPVTDLTDVSALAEEFSKATRLTRYQEGLRDETIRRQKIDLLAFARFLASVNTQAGDFYNDLSAWQGIRAGLLEAFIEGVSISKREKCTLSRTECAPDFCRWLPRRMKVQDLAVRKRFPLVKFSMASGFSKVLIQPSRLIHHLSVQKAGLDMLTPQ